LFQVDNDTGSCTALKEGRIRYTGGSPPWEYCNGSAWLPFKQPRCQDDDTGECYLDVTRSNDDPEFIAANIKSGVNILGVTGTLSGGSACSLYVFDFQDFPTSITNTLISSDIVQIDTDACSAVVSISGAGSPEYRICSNADCSTVAHDWAAASETIDDGEYLQLRMTTGSSPGMETITADVGGVLDQLSVEVIGPHKKVFVTSTGYSGNLGGVSGADAKCAARASAAGLAGTYKAWIADSTDASAPAVRFTQASIPYRRVGDLTVVADDWTDLTDGSLDADIDRDEFGNVLTTFHINLNGAQVTQVRTNVKTDGTRKGTNHCSNWTSSGFSGSHGGVAQALAVPSGLPSWWTDESNDAFCLDGSVPLYCFEQ
jgi:hypothetical protein